MARAHVACLAAFRKRHRLAMQLLSVLSVAGTPAMSLADVRAGVNLASVTSANFQDEASAAEEPTRILRASHQGSQRDVAPAATPPDQPRPVSRNQSLDAPVDQSLDEPSLDDDIDALLDQATNPSSPSDGTIEGPSLDGDLSDLPPTNQLDAPAMNLTTALATGSLGATRNSTSAAPAMMGDFFGSLLFDSGEAGIIALAGGDRRFKVSENTSPMPQNRVFYNYNYFKNALVDAQLQEHSLNRHTFGLEKATNDQLVSFEFRLPFSHALNSTFDFDDPVPRATELGNIGLGIKGLMIQTQRYVLSAGMTMTLPTGDDYVQRATNQEFLRVENEAVHLAPYLGFILTPGSQWFTQGFVQTDFDANGNSVISNGDYLGRLQDQNLLFVDLAVGRWLLTRRVAGGNQLRVAAITELHYTMTMNDPDFVDFIGNGFYDMDILNATMGCHFQYGAYAFRVGAAAPLRDDEEKLFDSEVFAQFSRAI